MDEDGKKTEGHTPTPWEYTGGDIWIDTRSLVCCGRGHNGECCGNPDVEGGQDLVAQTSEANAHLIVTAVNERSALLRCEEALRKSYVEMAALLANPNAALPEWPEELNEADQHCLSVAYDEARAALTLLDEVRK